MNDELETRIHDTLIKLRDGNVVENIHDKFTAISWYMQNCIHNKIYYIGNVTNISVLQRMVSESLSERCINHVKNPNEPSGFSEIIIDYVPPKRLVFQSVPNTGLGLFEAIIIDDTKGVTTFKYTDIINIVSMHVDTTPRKLQAAWTVEMMQDAIAQCPIGNTI